MKAELVKLMAEISKGADFKAEEVNEKLFEELVAASGKSETVAGEIIRAVNRIQYRYWNDGDIAGRGYGRETVNPAVRYLYEMKGEEGSEFYTIVNKFRDYLLGEFVHDNEYEKECEKLVEAAIKYVADKKLWEQENSEDMWDWRDDEEDVDRDDYEDEDL